MKPKADTVTTRVGDSQRSARKAIQELARGEWEPTAGANCPSLDDGLQYWKTDPKPLHPNAPVSAEDVAYAQEWIAFAMRHYAKDGGKVDEATAQTLAAVVRLVRAADAAGIYSPGTPAVQRQDLRLVDVRNQLARAFEDERFLAGGPRRPTKETMRSSRALGRLDCFAYAGLPLTEKQRTIVLDFEHEKNGHRGPQEAAARLIERVTSAAPKHGRAAQDPRGETALKVAARALKRR